MQALPHIYSASAKAKEDGNVSIRCENLDEIVCAPPAKFNGPGDQWSPEELLLSSISSCLVLSFRAVAKANQFEWLDIQCDTQGRLDKIERVVKFTQMTTRVRLTITPGADISMAESLIEKAEKICFVSNTLNCPHDLQVSIEQ